VCVRHEAQNVEVGDVRAYFLCDG